MFLLLVVIANVGIAMDVHMYSRKSHTAVAYKSVINTLSPPCTVPVVHGPTGTLHGPQPSIQTHLHGSGSTGGAIPLISEPCQ